MRSSIISPLRRAFGRWVWVPHTPILRVGLEPLIRPNRSAERGDPRKATAAPHPVGPTARAHLGALIARQLRMLCFGPPPTSS